MNAKLVETEITEDNYEEELNEIYGQVYICGFRFYAGTALRELDPVAFDCGHADYISELPEKWECSECGEQYEDEEAAKECCQDDETTK